MKKKYYDVFISYNPTNENSVKWINNSLVPYLRSVDAVRKYVLHYGKENVDGQTYSGFIKEKLENSAHLILVLSDEYLDKEWNNIDFRGHVRTLLNGRKADITCIQMNDVTDEEVEEFVRNEIQETNLRSFEIDECCFWNKIRYFLLRYRTKDVEPTYIKVDKDVKAKLESKVRKVKKIVVEKQPEALPDIRTPVQKIQLKPDSDVDFPDWNIKGPSVHIYDTTEASNRFERVQTSDGKRKTVAKVLDRLHDEVNTTDRKVDDEEAARRSRRHKKHKHKKEKNLDDASVDGHVSQVSASHVKPNYTAYVVRQNGNGDQYNMVKPSRSSRTKSDDEI